MALIRRFTRSASAMLGSFWVDMTRSIVYVRHAVEHHRRDPFHCAGRAAELRGTTDDTDIESAPQTITGGPIAAQEIIKQLGVDGGGFVAANSAAPNENPTPLTDFVFGRLAGGHRGGWTLYAVMTKLFVAGFAGVWAPEHAGNPFVHALGINGPNLESKDLRFGDTSNALSVTVATDTSSGAANVAYDSLIPLSVLVALINMQVGEIIFGGAGSGLNGMLILALLTVFIADLMLAEHRNTWAKLTSW